MAVRWFEQELSPLYSEGKLSDEAYLAAKLLAYEMGSHGYDNFAYTGPDTNGCVAPIMMTKSTVRFRDGGDAVQISIQKDGEIQLLTIFRGSQPSGTSYPPARWAEAVSDGLAALARCRLDPLV